MRTNRIADPKFVHEILDERFSFYRFKCANYRQRADFCDTMKTLPQVMSLRNSGRGEPYAVHVMAVNNEIAVSRIDSVSLPEDATLERLTSKEMTASVLLQLMLSSINKDELGNGPSNASGNFYLVLEKKFNEKKGYITEIVALEFRIVERSYRNDVADPYLTTHVRTFTNYKLKDFISFKSKNPPESYPKYVIDGPCIRRKTDADKGDAFILRRIGKKKSKVNYFSFENYDKMAKTKNWLISEVQESFNLKFFGMAELEFVDEPEMKSIRPKKKDLMIDYDEAVNRILKSKPVRIANLIGKDGEDIKSAISKRFKERGFKVVESNQLGFDSYTVKIIHDEAYYEETDEVDPHKDVSFTATQHVTLEDFDAKDTEVDVVATNLAIKQDIIDGKITIAEWASGKRSFAMKIDDKEDLDARYAILHIDQYGNMTFDVKTAGTTDNFRLGTAVMLKDLKGAVISGEEVNIIRDTDIITVPDIKEIRKQMKTNEKSGNGLTEGLRDEEGREEYLAEMIDINGMYADGDKMFYCVGYPGEGINSSLPRAVNVRIVEAWEESTLFFDELLELMDVPFVKHKQLTVIPYPFKYLREWCYMKGYLKSEEIEELIDEDP